VGFAVCLLLLLLPARGGATFSNPLLVSRSAVNSTSKTTNSTVLSTQAKVVDQYFDPEIEFLEIGAAENGRVTWKIPGPDLNGRYGGLNGIGGFEAYCPGPEFFCPILSDQQGNLHGVYDQQHLMITWYPSRVTGYGAVPGYNPVPFGDGVSLDQSRAFINRGADRTGFVWMGGNYYDLATCQFIGFDPRGHASSPNGRIYCGGDPVNHSDPDGRFAVAAGTGGSEGLKDFGVSSFHSANSLVPGGFLSEMLWGPLVNKADERFTEWRDRVVSGFSEWQGEVYAHSALVGEVAPNFIPIGGAEEAASSVITRGENWLVSKVPALGADLRVMAGKAMDWLAPRLNPANYEWSFSQLNTGLPLPEYTGRVPTRPPESPFYSVGFEARLQQGADYPGVSDLRHFQAGNQQLYETIVADPVFAGQMETLYPGITRGVQPGPRGAFPRQAPTPDVTWHHHPTREGVLQLVPFEQHTAPGPIQRSFHPNGDGGMENWGGGR